MKIENNTQRRQTEVPRQRTATRQVNTPGRAAEGRRTSSDRLSANKPRVESNSQRDVEEREKYRAFREAKRKRALKKRRNTFIRRVATGITAVVVVTLILVVFVFESPVKKGTEYLEAGNYDQAIVEFTNGLSDIDYIAESYKGIGIAYFELEQYKDAVDNLENAIQKGQTNLGTTYYLLAISYMKIEDYDNALKNISEALTKSDNSEELVQELRFNEVLCMELTSDWDGAKAKATSYLQSYPDDVKMEAEYKFLSTR